MDTKRLIRAIEDCGFEARSYSGRGMFGKRCLGMVVERDIPLFKVGMMMTTILTLQGERAIADELLSTRVEQDNLGSDTILYFPTIDHSDAE